MRKPLVGDLRRPRTSAFIHSPHPSPKLFPTHLVSLPFIHSPTHSTVPHLSFSTLHSLTKSWYSPLPTQSEFLDSPSIHRIHVFTLQPTFRPFTALHLEIASPQYYNSTSLPILTTSGVFPTKFIPSSTKIPPLKKSSLLDKAIFRGEKPCSTKSMALGASTISISIVPRHQGLLIPVVAGSISS